MGDAVFDLALEKRFTDSTEAVLVDITPADLMLIRNNETGVIMRLPFSVLAAAVSGALTGYMKSANNLSDVTNAGTARTNLGATTLGSNLFTLPNPRAVRFPRFNADNTVSALDAASFRAAIGAGTGSTTGTVTSVGLSAPTGFTVSGSPVTGSGTLSFSFSAGYSLPSNTAQAAWDAKEPGITAGTTSQYWRGDKSWQTLNTAAVAESTNLYYTDARVRAAVLTGYSSGANTALAATDTLLAALGKVQGQIKAREGSITAGTTSQYWRGDKSWQTLDKNAVGLGNVDNTSDAHKPVSTAQQTALNLKANQAQENWTAPTFLNSWINNGSGYNNAGFYKDEFGIVHLRGLVKSGTMQASIFTLPTGYRPAAREFFGTVSDALFGSVYIDPDGSVVPWSGSNAWFSLDGITFRAA